jgi:16S rRNA G527 N7-methylase RsmG
VNTTAKHLHVDGCLYAMKGQLNPSELDALSDNFSIHQIHQLDVPSLDAERNVIEIRVISQ